MRVFEAAHGALSARLSLLLMVHCSHHAVCPLQEDLALIITNTKRRRRPSPAPGERSRGYGQE
jgi:hypothetical protein